MNVGSTLVMMAVLLGACSSPVSRPTPSTSTAPPLTTIVEPIFADFDEPPVSPRGSDESLEQAEIDVPEIDCFQAEEMCDAGIYGCDEIADYCDIGPDDLEEMPDDYNWDGN